MTNQQAIGFMLLACKETGLTVEQADKLYDELQYLFDEKTNEQAEKEGFDWYRENI